MSPFPGLKYCPLITTLITPLRGYPGNDLKHIVEIFRAKERSSKRPSFWPASVIEINPDRAGC